MMAQFTVAVARAGRSGLTCPDLRAFVLITLFTGVISAFVCVLGCRELLPSTHERYVATPGVRFNPPKTATDSGADICTRKLPCCQERKTRRGHER